MRDDELSHDVVFVVNNQLFPAHRSLVAAASPVLRSMLVNAMKETSGRDIVLKEVGVDAWKAVLNYMYTARMPLFGVEGALKNLKCADWLQMEELADAIAKFIEHECDGWNGYAILVAIDRTRFKRLREIAMKRIAQDFYGLWSTREFLNLPFHLVLKILRCDELVINSELEVFLAVIHWVL